MPKAAKAHDMALLSSLLVYGRPLTPCLLTYAQPYGTIASFALYRPGKAQFKRMTRSLVLEFAPLAHRWPCARLKGSPRAHRYAIRCVTRICTSFLSAMQPCIPYNNRRGPPTGMSRRGFLHREKVSSTQYSHITHSDYSHHQHFA